jgi:hypothetical protein
MKVFTKIILILIVLSVLFIAGCSSTDHEPIYGDPLYSWNGTSWVHITSNGGGSVANVVTSTNTLTTDMLVRGDGGIRGVKTSIVSMDDFGNLNTTGDLTGFDINANNDVNITNDLDVTDDAQVGGDLAVTGTLTVGGLPLPDTFLELSDTPDSYVGMTDKVLVGNSTEDGLVFADPIPKATDWSGNFTWDTSVYLNNETDISALFSTALTGTTRRNYTVYVDLTNVYNDASFVSLYMSVQTKVDGTNYRAIDRKLILKADIAPLAEPGVVITMPDISQDTIITIRMSTATASDVTIYYTVVEEKLE